MWRGAGVLRAVVIVAVCLAAVAAAWGSWSAPDRVAVSGWEQTPTGPLGPADRDLLVKVKQAGLWEMPVGDDLAKRADEPRVREIGRKISNEHHELDGLVIKAAMEVGAALPDLPSTEQQQWIRQIAQADDPDVIGVNLLRAAHGKVLPLLASVKVGTRNETIRAFATESMVFVGRHISYLESTGLVDYAALPEPPAPRPGASPVKTSYYQATDRPTLAIALLVVALIVAVVAARLLRPSRAATPVPQPRHSRRRRR